MAINPIFNQLDNSICIFDEQKFRLHNLRADVMPQFEYIALPYLEAYNNVEEPFIPNCYYEIIDTTLQQYEHLLNLKFFKAPVLNGSGLSFDPRRYFYNFDVYRTETNPVYANTTNLSRSRSIVMTDIPVTSQTDGETNFFSEGYSKNIHFPIKNNLLVSNFFNPNNSNLIEVNEYLYHLISDLIKDDFEDFLPTSYRYLEETIETRRMNLSDDFGYLEQDDEWFSDHVAFVRLDDRENQTKQDKYINFKNKLEDWSGKNQTLFVKIEKKDLSGAVLQTYYISPSSQGIVKYSDSQVKIEKNYIYSFTSYELIKLNGVSYLYEIFQGEIETKIMQPPHPRPQVSFKNLNNDKNKIRLSLNLSSNKYTSLNYFGLSEEENDNFTTNFLLFDPGNNRDTIFNYETEKGQFQVFRMDKHPLSYYDIGSNARSTEVHGEYNSTLASFTDSIVPFKKYYYLIRSKNTYEYFSNPSPLYEVEMTKDANETFLNVNVVDFFVPDQNKYMPTKTMAKLLQIIPSSYQTIVDRDLVGDGLKDTTVDDLPVLGIVPEKIWDSETKFKIRLTSKKTGKKIDLNVKFNLNKNNSE